MFYLPHLAKSLYASSIVANFNFENCTAEKKTWMGLWKYYMQDVKKSQDGNRATSNN